jgi:bifunctional non-homologous end joining protein LigD
VIQKDDTTRLHYDLRVEMDGVSGGAISMPLNWSQVKADLDPKRLTIRTLPALIKSSSAWTDYGDGERSLEMAIKRLGKVREAA